MALDSRSEAESGTVTRAVEPLNESALPYLPAVDQVAVPIEPAFALAEASATLVPLPSLKDQAATRPAGPDVDWKVATRLWSTVGTAMTWLCGPPSDHEAKLYAVPPLDWFGAVIVRWKPFRSSTTNGVCLLIPSIVSVSPLGTLL